MSGLADVGLRLDRPLENGFAGRGFDRGAPATQAATETTEVAHAATEDFPPGAAFSSTTVYVARRRWHIDVGFAAEDLRGPLVGVLGQFPGARYAFFGFGDRHYLLSKDHEASALLAALWPGPGLILVTALESTPRQAFGVEEVIELQLTPDESRAIQAFIWHALSRQPGESRRAVRSRTVSGKHLFRRRASLFGVPHLHHLGD